MKMVARCTKPTDNRYAMYGARGITVCDRWRSFENFLADMGEKPDRLSIDRIDNDGPYAPGNCRWATPREQALNTRRNVRLTLNGETLCLKEWSARLGISCGTLQARVYRGWSDERVLTEPVQHQRRSA